MVGTGPWTKEFGEDWFEPIGPDLVTHRGRMEPVDSHSVERLAILIAESFVYI